ncbi:MAG: LLM class F420-dependent oxidoreductase, partial [Actinomycetota bacterium]
GNFGPAGVRSSNAERIDEIVAWVLAGAESVGRELPEIEIAGYFTVITPDEASGRATAEQFGQMFGLEADAIVEHPNCLIGTVDQVVERIVERRERYGISYVTVSDTNLEPFAPVVARLTGT